MSAKALNWIGTPARRSAVTAVAVFLLAFLAWSPADPAAAQDPPKRPPEEVEEAAPTKPKRTLRVEDDGADAGQPGRARAASERLADLRAEAGRTKWKALADVYQKFSVPHDEVRFTGTTRPNLKIEPFRLRVTENSNHREALRLQPLGEKGTRPKVREVLPKEVKSIRSFEELALDQVKQLLDANGSYAPLPQPDVLRAAKRVLTAVIGYHESALEQRIRQGGEWKELLQRLRDEMVEVQARTLALLAKDPDKNWREAYDLASELAQAYAKPDAQARFAKEMTPFIRQPLSSGKYGEVQLRLGLVKDLFPQFAAPRDLQEQLDAVAQDLVERAKRVQADNKVEANKLLDQASQLAPRLHSIQDLRLDIDRGYKVLNVGVRRLPEFLTPDRAVTDAERLAGDLLFEGLVKPVFDSDKGTRYSPSLAAERPRQIPLGRDFHLDPDAYWSDGSRVTATDVTASWRKWKEMGESDLIDEARPGDDPFRVSLSLRQGYLDPLSQMTFKILPVGWYQPQSRAAALEFARNPVGSGPYRYPKRDKDSTTFIANNNYHRSSRKGLPHIPVIRLYHSDNPARDFTKPTQNQRLHVLLDLPTRAIPSVTSREAKTKVNVHHLRNRRIYFLAVNHAGRNPLLKDAEFRRALGFAVDRTKILDDVFRVGLDEKDRKTIHRPLNGPFPPQSWAYNPKAPDLFKQTTARMLARKLNAAGSRIRLKFPNDEKFPNDYEDVRQACEAIAKQVNAATDVELVLEPCPPAQFREDVERNHEYELAYYHLDYPDEAYRLWPWLNSRKTGKNFLGYAPHGEMLLAFRNADTHREFDKVRAAAHQIHAIFQEEMPFIPLWQLDTHIAVHVDVQTYPEPDRLDPLHVFQDVEHWDFKRR